jgi:hypothetical protein
MAKRVRWLGWSLVVLLVGGGVGLNLANRRLEAAPPHYGPSKPVASLPSQTGNSGKFLTTNGTTASWAALSGLFFSLADYGSRHDSAGTNGNYTTGCVYYFPALGTVQGVRWFQPSGFTPLSTRIELWSGTTSSMTLVDVVTLTPTQGAINTVAFPSPHSFNSGQLWGISAYDGSHQLIYNSSGPVGNGTILGANLYMKWCGYGGGDAWPNSSSPGAPSYYGIDPIYTVP